MELLFTDGRNADFVKLCHLLDDDLNEIVGGVEKRAKYLPYNTLDDIHDVIVAYDESGPIGCASFKSFADEVAEVKRVFVKKEKRGRKISKLLMQNLEEKARKQGFRKLILETGALLKEAMALYESLGYEIIDNYGQYIGMPESICMQKSLTKK